MCRVPLVDVLVPMERLRAVLEAMRQQGQTQITFEGLRKSCLLALETDDSETGALSAAQGAVAELASAAAAVAAVAEVEAAEAAVRPGAPGWGSRIGSRRPIRTVGSRGPGCRRHR